MQRYSISGMSCAVCSTRVEKAAAKVDGVTGVSVSLLTNSMGVEGNPDPSQIEAAIKKAGYEATYAMAGDTENAGGFGDDRSGGASSGLNALNKDREITEKSNRMKWQLITSVILLAVLMYMSMGHMMWGWPIPKAWEHNIIGLGLVQLLITTAIMCINQHFFTRGFAGAIHGAPNMDTLVALGAGAAYVYSLYTLFAMTFAQMIGDMHALHAYMDELYFESAATILTLITVGKTLEARSKGKTTDALKSLMRLAPKMAVLVQDGVEKEVPVALVKKGDVFVVHPGDSIPVDGVVLEGSGSVNEAVLTGESIPVDKKEGDGVSAATINQDGYLTCTAKRVGEDTTLSQIIRMVSDAAATKAPIAKVADRVSGVFVPIVIAIAVVTIVIWMLTGQSFGFALARGISVLVISCPCALGLATPVAIMVGNGVGAKNGILFKTAVSLEAAGKAGIVVLDKTGTITLGEPKVTDVMSAEDVTDEMLIRAAYSLEIKSEHPLAKAVVLYGGQNNVQTQPVTDFRAEAGNGLRGVISDRQVVGGKMEFVKPFVTDKDGKKVQALRLFEQAGERFAAEGKTPLYFVEDGKLLGCIAVADVIKKDSPQAIRELTHMGLRVVMLTGDNEKTARAIGNQAGVTEIVANVLPDRKEAEVRRLSQEGKVIMVGDGINDAPALTRADVGIAIGAGTDVALDAADVVLMKSRLSDVPLAIRLSQKVLRNIHENLFWAFIYNVIGIPLAAGVWIPLTGWQLNPMFGAAAMGLSSFCVVSNALRLNVVNLHKSHKRKLETNVTINEEITIKESKMTKTLNINGMMCSHCEAAVKKALEAVDGVMDAKVSHEEKTAVVTLSKDVDNDLLKKAVEDKDYEVVSIA